MTTTTTTTPAAASTVSPSPFDALGRADQRGLVADLAELAREFDVHHSGDVAIASTYLETVLTVRDTP